MLTRNGDPWGEALSLRDAMDRLFQDSFVRPWGAMGGTDGGWMPVDMYEEDNTLVVKTSMPGLKPEDVDIRIEGDTLTITGESRSEETQPKMVESTTARQPAPLKQEKEKTPQTQALTTAQSRAMEAGRRNWYMHEQRYTRFSRSVTLPFSVNQDQAQATFDQGMLTLRLPKAEAARAKKIPIKSGT